MENNSQHWSNYWQQGNHQSCIEGQVSGYSNDINQVWERFFAGLSPSSQCLDLCTGNGAIVAVALNVSNQHSLNLVLTGVDLADIAPQVSADGVAFLANTSVTDLPVDDSSIDAISSHYGVEYCEINKVINESARVLKKGGVLQFFMHAQEGVTVTGAKAGLAFIGKVEECNFIPCLSALFALVKGESPIQDEQALYQAFVKLQQQYNNNVALLKQNVAQGDSGQIAENLLSVGHTLIANQQNVAIAQGKQAIHQLEQHLLAHKQRLLDLCSCALTASQLAEMQEDMESVGFTEVEARAVSREKDAKQIGWLIKATKQ